MKCFGQLLRALIKSFLKRIFYGARFNFNDTCCYLIFKAFHKLLVSMRLFGMYVFIQTVCYCPNTRQDQFF